eukprot:3215782-Pyramimonas_sp.AAC.1
MQITSRGLIFRTKHCVRLPAVPYLRLPQRTWANKWSAIVAIGLVLCLRLARRPLFRWMLIL